MVRKVEDISEGKVKLSIGGLYTTLHRMEEKGLVISRWGEPTEIRKGARRKYYKITGVGMQRWREATTAFKALIEYGLNPTCAGVI
jgi:DNA-binding PadR family transcriptional regulator